MATNDVLSVTVQVVPPASNAAELAFRAGGSTDNESFSYCAFDATTLEKMDFHMLMSPRYAGASIDVLLPWMAASATTGAVRWNAAIRRLDTGEDVDTSHTYSGQAVTSSAPAAAGQTVYPKIRFTSAQIDGLLAGEMFVLRVWRDPAHADDNMSGDAQLRDAGVVLIEV